MTSDDFLLMLEWLSKDHVKQWWNDGDDTLEKVADHYGAKSGDVVRFILVETDKDDEKPIGYFQYYFIPDGSIGIDQFIGEEDYINKGIGEKAIRMFIELIMQHHKPTRIILDPSPDNKRAIRCYGKIGFKHYETKKTEDGHLAYMMRLDCRPPAN
ncbi:MAG: GNAT family N-acetyltransferase [Pyrinomonadaceae bacterium]|nr:GNAT family N-acetyltransferase [Pyrinomonadaceae bacterium]